MLLVSLEIPRPVACVDVVFDLRLLSVALLCKAALR